MESKIKKRALSYGIVAVLLVMLVTVFAYKFGEYGLDIPLPVPSPQTTLLSTFESYGAIRDFLASNSKTYGPFPFFGPVDVARAEAQGFDAELSSPGLVYDYSTTNIQVSGVDEADIVKTDGEYIYALVNDDLLIVKAYPPEACEVVANVTFDDLVPVGIFVSGDRLIVLGGRYMGPRFSYEYGYYMVDIKTFARLYDIRERANPILLHDLTLTGSYFNSRMIDEYVYFVVSQPAYVIYDTVVLPKIYRNDQLVKEITPSEIHYYNGSDNYYQYTTFIALNVQNVTEAPTYLTLMLGGTSSLYVSAKNMYVTFPELDGATTIYRVEIENNNMTAEAKGQVSGNVLNQFSMDEYEEYFRIATSTWINGSPRSNVFILDMNLTTVGTLLDIEVGETLDSARFIRDRCYLSTSVARRDPFFVLDVENAMAPKILGYLKIPGLNRYLHPYDNNHVVGLGRDEVNNIKISLFDVTNVSSPKNLSEYRFEGYWSNTPALWDHKAFLFSYAKDLLAIPVSMEHYDSHHYSQGLFVFNITLADGLVLIGNITHQETGVAGWDTTYNVKRALCIEDVLYTISDRKMKLNDMKSLAMLAELPFA